MSLTQATKQVDKRKIWKMGVLAIAGSVVANLAIFFILSLVLDFPAPADFPPLSAGTIGFMTALFTFIGVIVFAVVARVAKNPVRAYWIIATIAFIISIIPNIIAALNPESAPFPFPVSPSLGFWVLIIFHVVAYLITAWILTTKTLTD